MVVVAVVVCSNRSSSSSSINSKVLMKQRGAYSIDCDIEYAHSRLRYRVFDQ